MVSDGEAWAILWWRVILPAYVNAEPYVVLGGVGSQQDAYVVLQIAGF